MMPLTAYRHVLVPVDFSEPSRRAVDVAAELAVQSRAAVTLLHVIELPEVYEVGIDPCASELDDWAELVEAKTRTRVARLERTGNPAAQVLSTVEDDPSIDLIVVGSHGRTGLQRLLLGSVAANIARHATRPVLVAR